MTIIITKRFEDRYLKDLFKNFSKKDLIEILKTKRHTFISLHQPYFKIKNIINGVNIRGIILILEEDNILPLMIFLKKDKKYGENVNWKDYRNLIIEEQKENLKDIENGDFERFS